jgi:hypothetical protein
MSSKDTQEMNLALQKATVDAANLYCRILELHLKTVAEGSDPRRVIEPVKMAAVGLQEELELLHSLRVGLIVEAREMGSPDKK